MSKHISKRVSEPDGAAHRVDAGAVAHVRCDGTLDLAPHPRVSQAVRLLEEEAALVGVRVRVGVGVGVRYRAGLGFRVSVREGRDL